MNNVDDLIEGMATSFAVSQGNVYEEHARYSQHKNEGKAAAAQRARREAMMQRQKNDREALLDRIRGVCCEDDEAGTLAAPEDFEMRLVHPIPPASVNGGYDTYQNKYDNYLMLSEWLEDIPGELSDEWTMLLCPKGRRVLVVAKAGKTYIFGKKGNYMTEIETALPGGCYSSQRDITMLDCVWNNKKGTAAKLFALDLLCWKSRPMVESDFECRRFFLQSKLDECNEERMPNPFSPLPSCSCTPDEMAKLINRKSDYHLDGLLFYYKGGFYTAGQTPLVGWLKPFMLADLFNITVPEKYMRERPPDNGEMKSATRTYIDEFNKRNNFVSSITSGGDGDGGGGGGSGEQMEASKGPDEPKQQAE